MTQGSSIQAITSRSHALYDSVRNDYQRFIGLPVTRTCQFYATPFERQASAGYLIPLIDPQPDYCSRRLVIA